MQYPKAFTSRSVGFVTFHRLKRYFKATLFPSYKKIQQITDKFVPTIMGFSRDKRDGATVSFRESLLLELKDEDIRAFLMFMDLFQLNWEEMVHQMIDPEIHILKL